MSEKERKERSPSGFLLKQRAFLKLYMITLTEQKRLYGLNLVNLLRDEFKTLGYKPNHPEVYKALHDLIDDGILEQVKRKKEGMKHQEVVYYTFTLNGKKKADLYKKQLKAELDRCSQLLQKSLRDNYGEVATMGKK